MSARDVTDIWAWSRESEREIAKAGGPLRPMVEHWRAFWATYHDDFDAADLAIASALEVARAEGERRWELMLRHWRLQLWLGDDVHRALPEAIDLLTLATDEQVRDVPQRICAFHDVVDCYARMDPAGYHDEIVANSQEVLAQLPERHPCADCARSHLMEAAAATGHAEEMAGCIARLNAHEYGTSHAGNPNSVGSAYETLGQWDKAAEAYARALDRARKVRDTVQYVEAILGLARAHTGRGDRSNAFEALLEARHMTKYATGSRLLARLAEVEGYAAEAWDEPASAYAYLASAAQQYLTLARYRDAALVGLHAAELGHAKGLDVEAALASAAQAIGVLPSHSSDLVARLGALGRTPQAPAKGVDGGASDTSAGAPSGSSSTTPAAEGERRALLEALASHTATENASGAAVALYRLGRWYAEHDEPRAAVDYFIANAVLERMLRLPMSDREDALGALRRLQTQLPAGAVAAALEAGQSGPSPLLRPLVGEEINLARWRWLLRGVAAEFAGNAAVEPAPDTEAEGGGFRAWVDHVASMTALVVRFRARVDAAACEHWAAGLDRTAADMEREMPDEGGRAELLGFVHALAALSRGSDPQTTTATVRPPFAGIIAQILAVAEQPVWEHPGLWPPDYLIEYAAQQAVRCLRAHDAERTSRLANMAFRFEMLALDLRDKERLRPVVRCLDALGALLRADGAQQPPLDPPLEAPFGVVLTAVYQASMSPPPDAASGPAADGAGA